MLSVFFGLIALILGLWGLKTWPGLFVDSMKGILPVSLAFVGLVAVIAGFSTMFENKKDKKPLEADSKEEGGE